ncbi:MAG TPA: hypothetical protein VN838_24255 [Bradyrhizobium sp.]|nr:hypothetical protein [Bradyrhizobium sp.]
MFRGSDFDRLAQQRVFAARDWIDAQPGLVAQGRAVCLFHAENRSPQFLEELIERFYRVYVFIDIAQEADRMSRISAAGHRAYPYKVFVARKQLEHCKSLVDREPPLRGASVIHLSDCGERQVLEQVQELYQKAKLLPQPDHFVCGNNGTVITSVLLDGQGLVIGATMFHHLASAGPEYSQTGLALNSVVSPSRSPDGSRNPGAVRSSLAAWLNAHAVVRSRQQFDTREIWSHPHAANRRSIAFHRELGSVEREDLSCFCVEHRTAPLDRRHGITAPVAAADGETV